MSKSAASVEIPFMDRVLDGQEKNQRSRNELYFLGGSDTSSSLILVIILAMMAYPNVQVIVSSSRRHSYVLSRIYQSSGRD